MFKKWDFLLVYTRICDSALVEGIKTRSKRKLDKHKQFQSSSKWSEKIFQLLFAANKTFFEQSPLHELKFQLQI